MRNATLSKYLIAAGLAALLVMLPFVRRSVLANSSSQAPAQAADGNITTTLADQTDLALTVYNSNLSLVRDVRQLNLPSGESLLRFMDIAASINPATVHFRSLTEPAKLNVLGAELRVRSARPEQAAAEIRGTRSHAGAPENWPAARRNMTK